MPDSPLLGCPSRSLWWRAQAPAQKEAVFGSEGGTVTAGRRVELRGPQDSVERSPLRPEWKQFRVSGVQGRAPGLSRLLTERQRGQVKELGTRALWGASEACTLRVKSIWVYLHVAW